MTGPSQSSSGSPASPQQNATSAADGAGELTGIELQIKRIQDKLQLLLKQKEALVKENGKLKEEIQYLREDRDGHSEQLEKLQQQVQILQTTKGEMSEAEKRVLEKRLGQYIREIDRCITLLSE